MTWMEKIFAELEAAGLIERNGEFRNNRPVFVPTQKGRDAADAPEGADDGQIISALVRMNINRFVVEVRDGVALFLNQPTDAADGWWWGNDGDALIWGPFETRELAVADAGRGAEDFKVVSWTFKNGGWDGDDNLPVNRYIIVIDTRGRLITSTGDSPSMTTGSRCNDGGVTRRRRSHCRSTRTCSARTMPRRRTRSMPH